MYLISMQWETVTGKIPSGSTRSPAIIAIILYPYPEADCCVGVRIGTVVVVKTTGTGKRLPVRLTAVSGVSSGMITADAGSAIVGIPDGSPRSMRMSLLAAEREFSTLMENVLVAVPEDVWKATTARPSASVVTRA